MADNAPAKTPLKDRSNDEKTAVAGGIAVAVVLILFIGWALFFFKKVSRGTTMPTFDGVVRDQFNLESVRKAQEQLSESYKTVTDEFRAIREQSGGAVEMQMQELVPMVGAEDAFGVPEE